MDESLDMAKLQNEIAELKDQVNELKEKVDLLTLTKMPNLRYPYSHWVLSSEISTKRRRSLEYALVVLTSRLENREFDIINYSYIDDENIQNLLFQNTIPNFADTCKILKSIIGFSSEKNGCIIVLLANLFKQGKYLKLCEHFLHEIKDDPEGELFSLML